MGVSGLENRANVIVEGSIPLFSAHGVVSSVGRVVDCGSIGHGFEPHTAPR